MGEDLTFEGRDDSSERLASGRHSERGPNTNQKKKNGTHEYSYDWRAYRGRGTLNDIETVCKVMRVGLKRMCEKKCMGGVYSRKTTKFPGVALNSDDRPLHAKSSPKEEN